MTAVYIATVTTLDDVVDANDGETSLREAIAAAGANAGNVEDRIVFAEALSGGTLSLTSGDFSIGTALSIDGDIDGDGRADITIDAGDSSRHFTVTAAGGLAVNGLTLINGSAISGGSVSNLGQFTATNTSFFDNTVSGFGGAIYNGASASADLGTVTFVGNGALATGGGIDNEGTLTVINGTFVRNSADQGGAIANNSGATGLIVHSTLTDNSGTGYGSGSDGGAIASLAGGDLTLQSSIVAGNVAVFAPNIDGSVTYAGRNLVGTQLSEDGVADGTIDLLTTFDLPEPASADVADLGGPVETVLVSSDPTLQTPLSGSSTITDILDLDGDGDTSELVGIAANGVERSASSAIGAFNPTTRLVVTTLSDESASGTDLVTEAQDGDGLSLREALSIANSTAADEVITFAGELANGTLSLALGQLTITDSVTIDGDTDADGAADITIDAGGTSRVVEISAGTGILNGLVLTSGDSSGGYGGGIFASGSASLTVTNSAIESNTAGTSATNHGGGIFVQNGTALIENTTLSNNTAYAGGGIYIASGDLTVRNSTLAGNAAATGTDGSGGGIFSLAAMVTVENSTISGNAARNGAGIFGDPMVPQITIENSIVTGNASQTGPEISGGFTANGGNIIAGTIYSGASTTGSATAAEIFALTEEVRDINGNLTGTTGGALRDNGGARQSVALLSGLANPAVDGGDSAFLAAGTETDVRGEGFGRVVGGTLDLGAFEQQQAVITRRSAEISATGSTATGTVSATDPDPLDMPSLSDLIGMALDDDIGDLVVNATGDAYTFTLDQAAVADLDAGDVQTFRYQITAADGGSVNIGIRVLGVDEGTAGRDTIAGTDLEDELNGNAGDDRLDGNEGDDLLEGGLGADTLDGGDGIDTAVYLRATDGVLVNLSRGVGLRNEARGDRFVDIEQIIGSGFGDVLIGNDLVNRIEGRAGDDRISGLDGADVLLGGSGVDVITGGFGNDRIFGAVDPDNLFGGNDEDELFGGGADDFLNGNNAADTLYGGEGDDNLVGAGSGDTLYGGTGNDTLNGGNNGDALFGGDNDDLLVGGLGADTLSGDAGTDDIRGGDGNDTLAGGSEADTLNGGANGDLLEGEDGNDSLIGSSGNDRLFGGEGDDNLNGGDNTDQLVGGNGNDTLNGGNNSDNLSGQSGDDRLLGGNGQDSLFGGSGRDVLLGGSANDLLDGGGSDDDLIGAAGQDSLSGAGGNDTLEGGHEADSLSGGTGADLFVFGDSADDGTTDTITDFESGTDTLQFGPSFGGLAPGQFTFTGSSFTGASGDLRFDTASDLLEIDFNGDLTADFQLIVQGDDVTGGDLSFI